MALIIDRFFRLKPESYTREYEGVSLELQEFITLDVPPANVKEVETLSGYNLGESHPVNTQSILDDLVIESTSPTQYVLNLTYIPRQISQNENTGGVPQVRVQFETWYTERVAEFDTISGLPIENSAGDPYNPRPVVQVPNDEIILVRRQSSVDLTRNADKGKVNDVAFTLVGVSIPPFCAMLSDYRFEPVYDDDGNVEYDVTYAFKTNYKKNQAGTVIGFKLELLNAGFRFLTTPNDKTTARDYVNDDGSTPIEPVKINADGTIPATANYKEFLIHETEDFGAWGLPTAWPY